MFCRNFEVVVYVVVLGYMKICLIGGGMSAQALVLTASIYVRADSCMASIG